jgi:transcriptional regulator with XRE-family HTH domain
MMECTTIATLPTRKPRKKILMSRRRKEVDTSTYSGKFAVRVVELRVRAGISAAEMAEKLGASIVTYQRWERGENDFAFEVIPKLAKILEVSVSELMPDVDIMAKPTSEHAEPDTSTYAGRFAVRLRGIRQSMPITYYELSQRLDIPVSDYLAWETGQETPPIEMITKIAKILDISVSALLPDEKPFV